MQAIIKTGGKQYKVSPGQIVNVEKLPGNIGDKVEFDKVLSVSDESGKIKVGTPFVKDSRVTGKILGGVKGEKITVFKFRKRKGYRRKTGHRQKYTSVQITEIEG
jgi:large subunit ribosomal protein L21